MRKRSSLPAFSVVLTLLLLSGCAVGQRVVRTSSLEFLYPEGTDPVGASDVNLQVPVRVGLAFAPGATVRGSRTEPLTEDQRQSLLTRIADAFADREAISTLEVIPSTYFSPSGSFQNLDRVRAAFGVDLILLLSYEQTQFTESSGASIAYWTIIGAYIIKGEKNETRTMLEAVVYDIPSRALLFRAGGSSGSESRSTPVKAERKLLDEARSGFDLATDDLIGKLGVALDAFEGQARTGTVRGVGTPAIDLVDTAGATVPAGGGAGSMGLVEWALFGGLAAGAALLRRRR